MKLDELDNRLAKAEADLGHTQVKRRWRAPWWG